MSPVKDRSPQKCKNKRKENLKRRDGYQKHKTEELTQESSKTTKVNMPKNQTKTNITTKNPKEIIFEQQEEKIKFK
jgi:hypothetical protein